MSMARSNSTPPGSDNVDLKQMHNISIVERHSVSIPPISRGSPIQDPQSQHWPLETDKGEAQPRGMV